jgi:hypothetical protein
MMKPRGNGLDDMRVNGHHQPRNAPRRRHAAAPQPRRIPRGRTTWRCAWITGCFRASVYVCAYGFVDVVHSTRALTEPVSPSSEVNAAAASVFTRRPRKLTSDEYGALNYSLCSCAAILF